MGDIGHSVGGGARFSGDRSTDPLYLEQIQQAREKTDQERIENPRSSLFSRAAAVYHLRKAIGRLLGGYKLRSPSAHPQKVLEHLRVFKETLLELVRQDLSFDPEYTQRLSMGWQHLYESSGGGGATDGGFSPRVAHFIRQIHAYPKDADHTLGYYLTEHAGQDWIPFPFMRLLEQLHHECLDAPTMSHLQSWIHEIDSILAE